MDDFVLVDDFGPFKPPAASTSTSASHYDDMFDSYFNRSSEPAEPSPSSSAPSPPPPPVLFDKPVFDDDEPDAGNPFAAIPLFGDGGGDGGGGEGEDSLDGIGKGTKPDVGEPEVVGFDDDFIPEPGKSNSKASVGAVEQEQVAAGFVDDLIPEWFGGSTTPMKPAPQPKPKATGFEDDASHAIPGFGESTGHHDSPWEEPRTRQQKESISSEKTSVSMPEDHFVTLGATSNLGYSSFGLFTEHLDMPTKSDSTKVESTSTASEMFGNSEFFSGVPKPMSSFSFASDKENVFGKNLSFDGIHSVSNSIKVPQEKPVQQASAESNGNILPELHKREAPGSTSSNNLDPLSSNKRDQLPEENQYSQMSDDVWLTVSDVVLVTQPTSAPPPSRPPPPLATKQTTTEFRTSNVYPHDHNQGYNPFIGPSNFASSQPHDLDHEGIGLGQDSSTFAAGSMDWAELKHSKGVNQGNFEFMFRSSQYQDKGTNEKTEFYAYEVENRVEEDRLEHERKQREKEEEHRKLERDREEELEREREMMRREHEERKRREKEKEARYAVEKAMREARERAAAEAHIQAERDARQRAERAAVQKVAAEARERAAAEARERAAKVAAEAKERAAEEAKERAAEEARERVAKAAAEARDRAAAEAREKAASEARAKAERAAVEKATAEARRRAERAAVERATAEARQRAANEARKRAEAEAQARESRQKTAQPDYDSFFGMPSRSSSVPRSQTATMNPFDVQPQVGADFGAVKRTASGSASPFAQPPSANFMDDLSSIFGAPSSSGVFQELDGESEERRKARLERHQRTLERAAKALAEKNERDLHVQREQEERHRISEAIDFEIKRWAAGKEGNLRALLSTLQYVLWPECGWRPVSLTDLITAASVKKEYRKATLCVHPDKVQQRGANLQQKYIAEKVFDLLKNNGKIL
uniref:J domain-containing protein n=1 Tax=Leersia perrieri TaxID=77586 RepID=A0A0D9V0Q5_9ORYZ